MAIEKAFDDLLSQLAAAHDALDQVLLTVLEYRPGDDGVVLVDHCGDALDAVVGWMKSAIASASEGRRAAAHPMDPHRVRLALIACQAEFSNAETHYHRELNDFDRLRQLLQFGRERGGEWHVWTGDLVTALRSCRGECLDGVAQALFVCWQELAERLGMSAISVQTTTVGQSIRGAAIRASESVNRTLA